VSIFGGDQAEKCGAEEAEGHLVATLATTTIYA